MTKKEITICGKQVTLAYCYATEIGYKNLAGEEMTDFVQESVNAIESEKSPNIEKVIYAIIAAMMAFYEDADKMPVKDKDIMKDATPLEIGTALGTILGLRGKFYYVPKGEPKEKPEEKAEAEKNA